MSKVNFNHLDCMRKSKLIHSLRRSETQKKKENRIKNCHNRIYSGGRGYYTIDEKIVGEYKLVTIPAHTEEKKEVWWEHTIVIDESSKRKIEDYIPHTREYTVNVPERTVKKLTNIKTVPIPETLRRIDSGAKYYRKAANKKVRKKYPSETFKNTEYKKLAEVEWELW